MPQVTIRGQAFNIDDDPAIQVGMPLTEGMAMALQRLRRTGIANAFSPKVESALGDAEQLAPDAAAGLQTQLNEAAGRYVFGARAAQGPRIGDPIEREARRDVSETIKAAFYAKHGQRLDGVQLRNAVEQVMASKGDVYRRLARTRLRERDRASDDILGSLNLGAAPQEAAEGQGQPAEGAEGNAGIAA